MSKTLRAFIVGYTGECGKALIKVLVKDSRYSSVKLIGRRDVDVDFGNASDEEKRKFIKEIIDFEDLSKTPDTFTNTDVGFCGLGTTVKRSGQDGQRKVDLEYVNNIGKAALAAGCKEYHIISSKGANAASSFFYLRLKGEMEAELAASCSFPKALSFFRPGTLLCNREEKRVMERAFTTLLKPIAYLAPTALTTPVHTLALALANAPFYLVDEMKHNGDHSGVAAVSNVYIVENVEIFNLANKNKS